LLVALADTLESGTSATVALESDEGIGGPTAASCCDAILSDFGLMPPTVGLGLMVSGITRQTPFGVDISITV
jgi:hypothetical protein